jgi:hypothetical protein
VTADVDFDALAVTPQLGEGDLLILRSDVIHKTQDATTQTVAASLRAVNSLSTLSRDELAKCGLLLRGQQREARELVSCFELAEAREITMERLICFRAIADARRVGV